jgi:hypothetical protein
LKKPSRREEYETIEVIRATGGQRRDYDPMWTRSVPTTFEDFQKKERTWKGFKYALRNIGLDIDVVRRRLIKGKTPWEDEEQQRLNCQKARKEYYNHPEREVLKLH